MSRPLSLTEHLEEILKQRPDGLTLEALGAARLKLNPRPISDHQLDMHLRSDPHTFVFIDSRWMLKLFHDRREQLAQQETAAMLEHREPPKGDRYVVFDLETTGIDPKDDLPIEVAGIRVVNGEIVERYLRVINPNRDVSRNVLHLTGIAQREIDQGALLTEALPEFLEFIGSDPLVGHNISRFDIPMLQACCERLGLTWLDNPVIDTMELACIWHPTLASRTLGDLGEYYALIDANEALHRAMADVLLCQRLFHRFCEEAHESPDLSAIIHALLPSTLWPAAAFCPRSSEGGSLDDLFSRMKPRLLPERSRPEAFDTDRIVAQVVSSGSEPRPAQIEMIRKVSSQLQRGEGVLCIEAPTGTGKSRAYLAPAIAQARSVNHRVIVAPHTRLLQEQLLREIENLPSAPVQVCRYMGKQNLADRSRLEQLTRQIANKPEESSPALRLAIAQVLSALGGESEGILYDLSTGWLDRGDANREGEWLRHEISLHNQDSRDNLLCYGNAMAENAKNCEILLTNQVMLMKSLVGLGGLGNVILDEAHNFEDATTLALQKEVGYFHLTGLANQMLSLDGRRGLAVDLHSDLAHFKSRLRVCQADLRSHLENLQREFTSYFRQRQRKDKATGDRLIGALGITKQNTQFSDWKPIDTELQQLIGLLASIEKETKRLSPQNFWDQRSLARFGENVIEFMKFLDEWRIMREVMKTVYSLAMVEEHWVLRSEPIDVVPYLRENFYPHLNTLTLTSATLTVEKSFDFFAGRVGLPKFEEVILPPTFDYAQNALLVLTNHLPAPRGIALQEEYPEKLSHELSNLIRTFGGSLLGLFTARHLQHACYDRVMDRISDTGIRLFQQGSGSLPSTIKQFRQDRSSSLFGVKSLWEGVNVEGDSLRFVAMAKLPFPPRSPLHEARSQRIRVRADAMPFMEYDLPLAVMQFKQGFGRLNRTASDRGAVIVMDRRLTHATYYKDAFLRSLPGEITPYYAEGQDFYQKIADFLDIPLDAALVEEPLLMRSERLLEQFALPQAVMSESEYESWRPRLLEFLRLFFGHEAFRPYQEEMLKATFCGRDLFAILPTGSGKSLTFQLPALLRPGLTLVISPLVALMKDQVDQLRQQVGAHLANCLMGGQSAADINEILDDAAKGRMKLLYLAPERLLERQVVQALEQANLIQVVVDEAHCVALWGQSFRPDFLDIRKRLASLPRVPISAVTATAPPAIRAEIMDNLGLQEAEVVIAQTLRPNLYLKVVPCNNIPEHQRQLIALVRGLVLNQGFSGIIYTATKRQAEEVSILLRTQNINAEKYHAGMSSMERNIIQDRFINDELDVIVATNAFGMGVDKPNVRFVIHCQPPESPEMYYQEVGRAGRDGLPAYGILLVSDKGINSRQWLMDNGWPKSNDLEGLLCDITDSHREGDRVYLDHEVGSQFPTENVKQWLHFLEQGGCLEKIGSFSSQIRLKLHAKTENILAEIPEGDRPVLSTLFQKLEIKNFGLREFATLSVGLLPEKLDTALFRHHRSDLMSARTKRHGLIIRLKKGDIHSVDAVISRLRSGKQRTFARMMNYINSRTCRWGHLRQTLGDTDVPQMCNQCDRCAPDRDLPWNEADVAFLPPDRELLDARGTVLQAIAHHHQGLGRGSIANMLAGQSMTFQGKGKYKPLASQAKSSPYFGTLKIGYSEVNAEIQTLIDENLAEVVSVNRSGTTYAMLGLTAQGIAEVGDLPDHITLRTEDESEYQTEYRWETEDEFDE